MMRVMHTHDPHRRFTGFAAPADIMTVEEHPWPRTILPAPLVRPVRERQRVVAEVLGLVVRVSGTAGPEQCRVDAGGAPANARSGTRPGTARPREALRPVEPVASRPMVEVVGKGWPTVGVVVVLPMVGVRPAPLARRGQPGRAQVPRGLKVDRAGLQLSMATVCEAGQADRVEQATEGRPWVPAVPIAGVRRGQSHQGEARLT